MSILKLVLQVLLGLAFIMFGALKLSTPYDEMIITEGMTWAQDYSETMVNLIGGLEVLGGLAMILPLILKRWYALVPLAALGFMGIMVAAAITHLGRDESIAVNIMLFVVSGLVFWINRGNFRS